jgi:hypothetical protein
VVLNPLFFFAPVHHRERECGSVNVHVSVLGVVGKSVITGERFQRQINQHTRRQKGQRLGMVTI